MIFKKSPSDIVNIHNYSINSITTIDIINNADEEIYNKVIKNTKKNSNYNKKDYEVENWTDLLIKPEVHKIRKICVWQNKS